MTDKLAASLQTLSEVYQAAFFDGLARRGIPVTNEKEAADLLEIAQRLEYESPNEKAASYNDSAYSNLVSALRQNDPSAYANELYKVAATLASEPDIYNAVINLAIAEQSGGQNGH
jgi:hypothetical protein